MWRSRREILDGFVIGVLSASVFTAAATLTRLAPQFTTAPVARSQPVQWLFFEAAVRGVTVPLTAACAGGLVGIALWFHRSRADSPLTGWKMPVALALVAVTVLGVYAAVGWADIEGVSQLYVLSWHVAMALVALIGLRIGLQVALLHERAEPATGTYLLCLHCRHVVPEMAFCPSCGAATRATPHPNLSPVMIPRQQTGRAINEMHWPLVIIVPPPDSWCAYPVQVQVQTPKGVFAPCTVTGAGSVICTFCTCCTYRF